MRSNGAGFDGPPAELLFFLSTSVHLYMVGIGDPSQWVEGEDDC